MPPAAKPADITAPGAPLDRDDPVYGYVSDDEGGQKLDGYVPRAGKSGVTVGTGVDLGQRDADDIRKLDIPPELAEKLVPLCRSQARGRAESPR